MTTTLDRPSGPNAGSSLVGASARLGVGAVAGGSEAVIRDARASLFAITAGMGAPLAFTTSSEVPA